MTQEFLLDGLTHAAVGQLQRADFRDVVGWTPEPGIRRDYRGAAPDRPGKVELRVALDANRLTAPGFLGSTRQHQNEALLTATRLQAEDLGTASDSGNGGTIMPGCLRSLNVRLLQSRITTFGSPHRRRSTMLC